MKQSEKQPKRGAVRCAWRLPGMALAMVLGLVSAPVQAEVLWSGDFETGNVSQWSYELNPEGLTIVTDPVLEGQYAAQIELSTANRWQDSSMYRVELQHVLRGNRGSEGTETYFGWSVYLPEPLPTGNFQLGYFETDITYNQVFSLHARGAELSLFLNHQGGAPWRGADLLEAGKWHRFVYHVVWSADPSVGSVSLWVDGVKWVDARPARTYVDDQRAFIQLGLFSNTAPSATATLYVDAAMEGESYQDVAMGMPEMPAPEPPPAPPPAAPPMPEPTAPNASGSAEGNGGCRLSADAAAGTWEWLMLLGAASLLRCRRRRR